MIGLNIFRGFERHPGVIFRGCIYIYIYKICIQILIQYKKYVLYTIFLDLLCSFLDRGSLFTFKNTPKAM